MPRRAGHKVLRIAGTACACWLIGLVFIRPGLTGLVIMMAVELGLIISISLFNPVLATYRLEHTDKGRVARTLSAWSITSSASNAVFTALTGFLADATSPRTAIAVAGLLLLATPFLLPRRAYTPQDHAELASSPGAKPTHGAASGGAEGRPIGPVGHRMAATRPC